LSVHSLPAPAAARLFPGLSIKALDPVGTGFLLLITTNHQKVTENFTEEVILNPLKLYYRFRRFGQHKAPLTQGFDAAKRLQVDGS
jgi:hypothetical protein